jgi:clan AA aspartic protease
MIYGQVNADREGIIRLKLQGPQGHEQEVEAVMDTGFNGFLTVPPALAAALGCLHIGRGRAVMANGQSELFDVYEVTVVWDGQPRTVEADAADTDALIGMSLIYGYELRMQAVDGGRVTIEAMP